jgi:viroplasmin and RNaseH domain-containing protein
MGLYILDSDGDLYVEGSMIIKETRGHREVYKRFQSKAEAEAYMRSLIDKGKPKYTPEEYREMNGKHRKSHRLKNSK